MSAITSRVPFDLYSQVPAVSITRLKEIKRSPQHYRHALTNPRDTGPMRLGTAAHCAVLEPERFAREFAVWSRRTSTGAMAPRNGQHWEAFKAQHDGRTIITEDDYVLAMAMRDAVRGTPAAMRYLEAGDPEVTLQWQTPDGRACKGRVDWLTQVDGPVLVGLKTARDCRHFAFGAAAAKLGYPMQWSWYQEGYETISGVRAKVVEIVVESAAPHSVAVYHITDDILAYGREEYRALLKILDECEATNVWPGPVPGEEILTLPSWCYEAEDDIGDMDLVA
jgi:hypothetical protein